MGTHKTVSAFKKKNKVRSGSKRLINLMLTYSRETLKWFSQAVGEHSENKAAAPIHHSGSTKTRAGQGVLLFSSECLVRQVEWGKADVSWFLPLEKSFLVSGGWRAKSGLPQCTVLPKCNLLQTQKALTGGGQIPYLTLPSSIGINKIN